MAGYLLDLFALIAIFGAAASVVAYLAEEAGFVHVGSAGVMAVGAYTVGLLTTRGDVNSHLALLATLPVGAAAGILLHTITRPLSGDLMALATLAVGIIVHSFILNADVITNGPMGVSGIPAVFSWTPLFTLEALAFVVLVVMTIVVACRSPFGKRVRAVREDEILAEDLGLSPLSIRANLWIGSSALLALTGGFFALHLRYIDPSSFTVRESVSLLAMALLVPKPRYVGPLFGAFIFVAMPELFRFVGFPSGVSAQLRQLLFGLALLVVVSHFRRANVRGHLKTVTEHA